MHTLMPSDAQQQGLVAYYTLEEGKGRSVVNHKLHGVHTSCNVYFEFVGKVDIQAHSYGVRKI